MIVTVSTSACEIPVQTFAMTLPPAHPLGLGQLVHLHTGDGAFTGIARRVTNLRREHNRTILVLGPTRVSEAAILLIDPFNGKAHAQVLAIPLSSIERGGPQAGGRLGVPDQRRLFLETRSEPPDVPQVSLYA